MDREFKAGDRVVLTDDNDGYGRKGAEGRVLRVILGDIVDVRFDEEFCGHTDWFAGPSNIAHVVVEETV